METVVAPRDMTRWAREQRARGRRIGFVPTMGFLHEGHTSLMDRLRPHVDLLVTSIYVNPLQFGPGEDLERYPRDPEGDAARCEAHGVDVLFTPDQLYPSGFSSSVSVHGLTDRLCGASRPGHFEGVCTVVARLFNVVGCDTACFGEKDYQQLAVIRRMVRDLAMPVEVVAGPLVRDSDGLALSSRNKYLSADDRRRALSLYAALDGMVQAKQEGEARVTELLARGRERLDVDALDYLEIVDAETLEPVDEVDRSCRALVAAHVGGTRLIDNVPIGPELSWT